MSQADAACLAALCGDPPWDLVERRPESPPRSENLRPRGFASDVNLRNQIQHAIEQHKRCWDASRSVKGWRFSKKGLACSRPLSCESGLNGAI
jgi:hypothetical protein